MGGIVAGDDFAIFPGRDKALITNNGALTLTLVDIRRKTSRIAANSTLLQAISALAFGPKSDGVTPLYVAASSGSNGNATVGSALYAEIGEM